MRGFLCPPFPRKPGDEQERTFHYDALYRLDAATGREHASKSNVVQGPDDPAPVDVHPNDLQALRGYEERYTYDEAGNLTKLRHRSGTGAAAPIWVRDLPVQTGNNRLLQVGASGETTVVVVYDDAGNVREMPGVGTLHWDARGRLEQVDLGGGGTAFYVYDGAGQRVRKVVKRLGTTVEERIYLGGYEVYTRRTGTRTDVTRRTVHVGDGKQSIALIETKTVENDAAVNQTVYRFELSDHLDSTRIELDAAGAVLSVEEYYPYGGTSLRAATGVAATSLKRYRYGKKERDEETGLYHYGARYYAAWWGRWVSCDPVQSNARYRYCADNPMRHADPDGCWQRDMHFLMVYWTGLMAGADEKTARQVAMASELPDEKYIDLVKLRSGPSSLWAPGLVARGAVSSGHSVSLGRMTHSLGIGMLATSRMVQRGAELKDPMVFGFGMHMIGDYLPHAAIEGRTIIRDQVGHPEQWNQNGSRSTLGSHSADFTHANPLKARITTNWFIQAWGDYLGRRIDDVGDNDDMVEEFIRLGEKDESGRAAIVDRWARTALAAGEIDQKGYEAIKDTLGLYLSKYQQNVTTKTTWFQEREGTRKDFFRASSEIFAVFDQIFDPSFADTMFRDVIDLKSTIETIQDGRWRATAR